MSEPTYVEPTWSHTDRAAFDDAILQFEKSTFENQLRDLYSKANSAMASWDQYLRTVNATHEHAYWIKQCTAQIPTYQQDCATAEQKTVSLLNQQFQLYDTYWTESSTYLL